MMDSIYLTYPYKPVGKTKNEQPHVAAKMICDVIVILKLRHHVGFYFPTLTLMIDSYKRTAAPEAPLDVYRLMAIEKVIKQVLILPFVVHSCQKNELTTCLKIKLLNHLPHRDAFNVQTVLNLRADHFKNCPSCSYSTHITLYQVFLHSGYGYRIFYPGIEKHLSVTTHINYIAARCLINIVYLRPHGMSPLSGHDDVALFE